MSDTNGQPAIHISTARKELLAKFADAAGSLYGVLSIAEFIDVFNHYENEKTNEQETILALQQHAEENPDTVEYNIYEEFITGPTIHPDCFAEDLTHLKAVRKHQEGKARYLPARKEFLKYINPLHREPEKPYADLKAYILNKGLGNDESITDVDTDLWNLYDMIQDQVKIEHLIGYFTEKGYTFNGIDELNDFLQVVMNAYANTRLFENNGHTPQETKDMQDANRPKKPVVIIPKKVGRNDPCPCGSGKKFKKCCDLIELSGAAQLSYDECVLFYETWYKLLDYVNKKKNVVKGEFSLKYPDLHDESKLQEIRERVWKKPSIISDFIKDANYLTYDEVKLLKSWEKHHIKGHFLLVKYTPWHAVMMRMDEGEETKLYAVLGMTSSIAEAVHSKLPVLMDAVLLPFGDKIVYDSYLAPYPFEYGGNSLDMLDKEYAKSEEKYGIISSLQDGVLLSKGGVLPRPKISEYPQ